MSEIQWTAAASAAGPMFAFDPDAADAWRR